MKQKKTLKILNKNFKKFIKNKKIKLKFTISAKNYNQFKITILILFYLI